MGEVMYIIIVGAGKVGYHLGRLLMAEGHEVMLIEEDRSKVELLSLEFHDAIMQGNGSTVEVLKEAGANRADVVVATTGNDEDNLVICQIAKLMFLRPRTIARVNNPRNEELFTGLGVDASVSATKIINAVIQEQVKAGDMMIPLAHIESRRCGDRGSGTLPFFTYREEEDQRSVTSSRIDLYRCDSGRRSHHPLWGDGVSAGR